MSRAWLTKTVEPDRQIHTTQRFGQGTRYRDVEIGGNGVEKTLYNKLTSAGLGVRRKHGPIVALANGCLLQRLFKRYEGWVILG